jgi:transcriptional regulator with XRE-family HTH domain
MSKLGNNVTKLRTGMGLSGRKLAKQVDIDHSYLSRIESGEQDPEKISYGVLKRLSKSLGVSIGELTSDPGYRNLDKLVRKMTRDDMKIFNKIVDLPRDDEQRRATMQVLGLSRRRTGKKSRKSGSRTRRTRR